MKMKTAILLFSFVAFIGLGLAEEPVKYVLKVKGLSCPLCANGLEKKLKKVEGVESVSIDLEKAEAVVTAKTADSVREEDLRQAVKKAGFQLFSLERAPSAQPTPNPGSEPKP